MKLKIGNTVLNQRALTSLFLIFFIVGVCISIHFALKEDGKDGTFFPMIMILVLVIPKLIRGIREEIENERTIENDEAS